MVWTMTLDDIQLPAWVKVNFIEKQYYSKYFCKLVLAIDASKIKSTGQRYEYDRWSYRYKRHSDIAILNKKLCKEVLGLLGEKDYRLRREGKEVAVFFNDEEILQVLKEQLSKRITEFHRPLNDAHKEVVVDNRRIRVRKSLFEKHFKFKVYLTNEWTLRERRYKEFQEWIDSMDNPRKERWKLNHGLTRMFNPKANTRTAGYTMAIYLNDPEDLMMCQLKFNDKIQYVEEAVLLQDL
jgi:hypothetical protein